MDETWKDSYTIRMKGPIPTSKMHYVETIVADRAITYCANPPTGMRKVTDRGTLVSTGGGYVMCDVCAKRKR